MQRKTNNKQTLLCIMVPVGISVIFALLCMLNLRSAIWFDESYSAYLTRGSFADIWNLTAQDVHPPFFYFLLKIWSDIFGYTDVSLRFMSVFFGALTIIFLFQLLKRWFGTKAATISSFFLAFSPMFIRYGQEMRMYSLVFLIVVLATYALDLALTTQKTRYFVFYAILIALGMWTHYFTAIVWIVHIIYYKLTKQAKIFSKRMLLTYLLAVLLFLPWTPSFLHQVAVVQGGFWISAISLLTPIDFYSNSLTFMDAEYATGWVAILLVSVVIFTTFLLKRSFGIPSQMKKNHLLLIVMLVFVPPAILMIFSLPPLSPIFVDRYIIYSACLLWVLFGLLVSFSIKKTTLQKKYILWTTIALIISCIASAVIGIVNVTQRQPEGHITEIIPAVKAMTTEGEPILMNNEWNYYDAVFYSSDRYQIYGINDRINYIYGSIEPIRKIGYNLITDLPEFLVEHNRIWYVTDINPSAEGINDYELPTEFANYRIVSDIVTDHFVALELEKTDM